MKTQVNVLFLLNSLCIGGAEKHAISLLNNLDLDNFKLSLGYLKNNTTMLSQINSTRGIDVFHCNVTKKVDFSAAKKIAKHVDTHDIDIIISTNQYPLLYSLLSKLLSEKRPKIIEVFHTTELLGIKSKLQMCLYKQLFRFSDQLVYVCNSQQDYWMKKGMKAKSVHVIHNGIDTEYFKDYWSEKEKSDIRSTYNISNQDYLIGISAALRKEKAHGDLLQAISQLKQTGVPVKCLIIGDGVERKNIEEKILNLGLENDVYITGYQQDVRPLLVTCDVMVITSRAVETFSIAALEAMSLGLPLIMSDIGGAKEQVKNDYNGYLFRPGNINELKSALQSLKNRTKRKLFGQRSRQIITQQFMQQKMIQQFEQLLMTLNVHQP